MKMPKTCPLLDEWIERIVIGPSRAKYAVILSELEWAQIVMPEQIWHEFADSSSSKARSQRIAHLNIRFFDKSFKVFD